MRGRALLALLAPPAVGGAVRLVGCRRIVRAAPATPPLHLSHDAVLDATRRRACVATSPLTFHILCNAAGVGPGATSAVRRYHNEIARAKKQRGTARSDDKGPVGAKRAATTGAVRVLSYGAHICR